jgi:acetyl esterase/lipase
MPLRPRAIAFACTLAAGVCGCLTAAGTAAASCTSGSQAPQRFSIPVSGQTATGYYSLPSAQPRGIIVVGHGFPGTARDVAWVLERVAAQDQAIAVAMDYRGTDLATGLGFRVIEGAQDSIAATRMFDSACAGGTRFLNAVVGVSMGGTMSGIAVSSGAHRDGGAPLFDYWFDVAGVTDLPEVYAEATAITVPPFPGWQAIGRPAKAGMEAEFGGSPATAPGAYVGYSPIYRAGAMRASGLRGALVFHGAFDGLVTSDQSVQMASALARAGIPTNVFASVFKTPGTASGVTLDSDVLSIVPGYDSPFAGHINAVLVDTALSQLHALYSGGPGPSGLSVTLADGVLGTHPLALRRAMHLPRL